ncbi:MAG: hypothetical protein Q8T04_18035 [Bacteroidota bacterium]|nr:hypothetical protein [Bacteroidota bacterium]
MKTEMKKLKISQMEAIAASGCNDPADAVASQWMCVGFFVLSYTPLWAFGVVGSVACLALGLGCAYKMGSEID